MRQKRPKKFIGQLLGTGECNFKSFRPQKQGQKTPSYEGDFATKIEKCYRNALQYRQKSVKESPKYIVIRKTKNYLHNTL